MYCKSYGKVTFKRPFLLFGQVTFNEHVNALQRHCKVVISDTFTEP